MGDTRIRIVVHGALGKMGREVISHISKQPDMELVGGADNVARTDSLALENGDHLPIGNDLSSVLTQYPADVVVDFSVAEASLEAARTAITRGVRMVIGTTGFSQADMDGLGALCAKHRTGAFVAPNFTIGAVLMVHLSKIASRFFDYAEIIELHHEQKLDAPSGTAVSTARAMAEARGKAFRHATVNKETLKGARGAETDGIAVHSVRMPGLLAHQEVILGGPGQTLTIRHDSINRECYMPGVALAIREVVKRDDLVVGLDRLMGL